MADIQAFYPLSPMQEGMLYQALVTEDPGIYVIQHRLQLAGAVDGEAFREAWRHLVTRHAVLRTAFAWEGLKEPVQVVRREVEPPIEERDWSGLDPVVRRVRLETGLDRERERGFDLKVAPLFRLELVRLAADESLFVWTFHHLILDGWSALVVLRELFAVYEALRDGRRPQLPEATPYQRYIAWVRGLDEADAERFWRSELGGVTGPTRLWIDRGAPGQAAGQWGFGSRRLRLPAAVSRKLQAAARTHSLTPHTLLQGAWALVLAAYSGEDEVVFGSVVLGRPDELRDAESMVGLFINTVPVPTGIPAGRPLAHWLSELQERHLQARRHAHWPLSRLQSWSGVPQPQPLLESYVSFERYPGAASGGSGRGGASSKSVGVGDVESAEHAGLPLVLAVRFEDDGLALHLSHDLGRFRGADVGRLLHHLAGVLGRFAEDLEAQVDDALVLSPGERHLLLWEANDTAAALPVEAAVHRLLGRRAAVATEAVAVVAGREHLSYGELFRRAHRLARHLRARGGGADRPVAVMLGHGPELIVTLLAALEAGSPYVPLDPVLPPRRVAFMLEDCGARLAVTVRSLSGRLPEELESVVLDEEAGAIGACSAEPLPEPGGGGRLAYTIYTSGSTGRPKGVEVTHQALANFLRSMAERPGLDPGATLVAVTTPAFDIAALELFLPLLAGGRVVLVGEGEAADPERLERLLAGSRATALQATPATYRLLLEASWSGVAGLRALCGGETLTVELADRLLSLRLDLWNVYGPTETTVWSTAHRVCAGDGPVPVGRPIANTGIYLLDPRLRPVPLGVAGELHIAGDGLARGYRARPAATAAAFLPDPFRHLPGGRIYRTGDVARYGTDGLLRFLGRRDQQVKVRGFRVELSEIEAVAEACPGVGEAACAVRGGSPGDRRLALYFVSEPGSEVSGDALRDFLAERLPVYMLPAFIRPLDEMPRTPNEKLDRSALPEPRPEEGARSSTPEPPRDSLERQLVEIWEAVLGVAPVGVRDDFFELGGHSLLAIRLMARVGKELRREVPLAILLSAGRTVEGLARVLRVGDEGLSASPLVLLADGGGSPPFFCVHPIGGHVFGFRNLASSMDGERPFYGLRAEALETAADRGAFTPLDELAARYLEAIEEVQPAGPYLLGGYSFGGYVAFEMACQLVRARHEVALLALLDTPAPGEVETVLDSDYATVIAQLAREHARQAGGEVELRAEELSGLDRDEQIRHTLSALEATGVLEAGGPELDSLRRLLTGHRSRLEAVALWRPATYAGRVTLFRAAEREEQTLADLPTSGRELYDDPELGWTQLAAGGVDVEEVPGYHATMLRPPQVARLAESLRESIARSLRGPPVHAHRPPPDRVSSLVELVEERAAEQGDRVAFRFLELGEAESGRLTFGELHQASCKIAGALQEAGAGGERALLTYPPGLEFITAFFGCLYAGVVPVPVHTPRREQGLKRLLAVVRDARPAHRLTIHDELGRVARWCRETEGLDHLGTMSTDALPDGLGDAWRRPEIDRDSLAFLQYTSGSTAAPKGVMVTHGNLLSNNEDLILGWPADRDSTMVSWLPLFHDLGLIYGVVHPLFGGFSAVLMSPFAFVQKPVRWLRALTRYRGTHSAAPNFAYELAAQKARPEHLPELDLSSWRVAAMGAEPLRWDTMRKFSRVFGTCGFRWEAFCPAYGLAEATLKVTAMRRAQQPRSCPADREALEAGRVLPREEGRSGVVSLVGCGGTEIDTEVVIVDPATALERAPDEVGEIWVRGATVARGYWNRPEATRELFQARLANGDGPFLRTGDLGFVRDGHLFVTGRIKDLIIITGRNLYPQDIEAVVAQCHPDIRLGGVAAFSVSRDEFEQLVVAVEVRPRPTSALGQILSAVHRAVSEEFEVRADAVVPLRPGGVLKTTSGKVQRSACRALYLAGELKRLEPELVEGLA